MRSNVLKLVAAAVLLAGAGAVVADDHPAVKRPFELPPSADLNYHVAARQKGFGLNGDAVINWRTAQGKYALTVESRVPLLGKISDNRSEGTIDSFGLAPAEFYEKRYRKEPTTTAFNRDSRTLTFADGKLSYPLKGGEQDRASVTWQLAAVARAAGERFKAGSEWRFFVAGRRDAESWTFKVVRREKVRTGLGDVEAVHVVRVPLPDSQEQTLDIWLAPGHEWYPVKLRFTDNDDEFIEQTLEKIVKR